jgi:release factor family 2
MDASRLSDLYGAEPPLASVTIDVSHDTENGAREHELRVRAACRSLEEQGAGSEVVRRVEATLGELVSEPSPVGRTVVANSGGVVFDELLHARVDDTVATWGPLPDVSGWIEHQDRVVTFVLAVVDHRGGDVGVYRSDLPEATRESSVGGETHHEHQVPVGGWSALRYQHATENVWARNAEAVAEEIASQVRAGHRLVLLAGDPQSRPLVLDKLNTEHATVVELDSGSRAEDGGEQALQQAIREALLAHVVARRLDQVRLLQERLGRDEAVARDLDEVADAFVRGQVETVLLDPSAARELTLDPAAHPGLPIGPALDRPVRADLAVVAAAALTAAEVSVSRAATLGGSPVAALLRWDQEPVAGSA